MTWTRRCEVNRATCQQQTGTIQTPGRVEDVLTLIVSYFVTAITGFFNDEVWSICLHSYLGLSSSLSSSVLSSNIYYYYYFLLFNFSALLRLFLFFYLLFLLLFFLNSYFVHYSHTHTHTHTHTHIYIYILR